jgi:hypothetical protein
MKLGLQLANGRIVPGTESEVARFVTEHEVSAIIVSNVPPGTADRLASIVGGSSERLGGVTLLRIAPCPASG